MNDGRVVSTQFPYIPVHIQVQQRAADVEALLDTGFDGDVVVPPSLISNREGPSGYEHWTLADGSVVTAPYYAGTIRVGHLGSFPAFITALGNEPLVGRSVAEHFTITLDHGQRVIVQP